MSCMRADKLIQLDRSQFKHRTEAVARKDISQGVDGGAIQWKVGEMLFEAHVRMLDDMVSRLVLYIARLEAQSACWKLPVI